MDLAKYGPWALIIGGSEGVGASFARQLVVNAFEITKPYFSFDAANRFVELGKERHRGVEVSLSGHFWERLHLVGGAVVMKPEVTGPAVGGDLVGKRPAGTPTINVRIDANYRTDLFGGLTPTATVRYTGKRAASSNAFKALGDRQLMLPGFATIDLGLRQKFKIGKVPVSFRAVVENVLDKKAWKVVAADALYSEERRRLTLYLAADF
jgi:iron complex outermembrane receptor protein